MIINKSFDKSFDKTIQPPGFLIHPLVDFLMIGGLSLILFSVCYLFIPKNQNISVLSWTMFYLSFVVNYPHFLISYQFLYLDNFKKITKDWRLFLSGVIAPVGLLLWLAGGVVNPASLGFMVNAMFFLVGHHYVKQIIGCMVVSSALKGVKFSKNERLVLSLNMTGIWAISYISSNVGERTLSFHGIPYSNLNLPSFWVKIIYLFILISLLVFIFQMIQKYINTGQVMSFNSFVAFLSIYAWYIPAVYHPGFFYVIPFFHSLQYLLFAFAYVKNKYLANSTGHTIVEYRKNLVQGIGFYIGWSFILGFLFFWAIPYGLDKTITYSKFAYNTQLFMFAFVIFINIHHYFIDFAIWRRDNPNVRKYLFT